MTSATNERQQKLERALLELGHFQQAYEQLIGWIDKATDTVNDINATPGDLRQNEIELAKHKVGAVNGILLYFIRISILVSDILADKSDKSG